MSMRSSVFRRPEVFESYDRLLNEVKIWSKFKDPIPLDLACKVYTMMNQHARAPYNGLELAFYTYFEESWTPVLVEKHMRETSRRW